MDFNYQVLFENVQDLVFALTDQATILYANRYLCEFTGLSKEQLQGRPLLERIYPPDHPWANKNLEIALSGHARSFESRFISDSGSAVYFSTNMTPIQQDGRVIGAVGISRDINERIKLEQEITELKNFNESIIQSIQSGLITLDLEGVITSYNLGAEEVLGWPTKEMVGRPLAERLGTHAAEILSRVSPILTMPPNREVTVMTKSGNDVTIGFTVTPRLDDQGQRVGTIISFKDISQIKRMQAEVIRMDRLASLGVLASGMAHEIKNPLAGIKAMAQSLQEEFAEGDDRIVYLDRIVRQVNRLDELLKAFFDYARPRPPMRKFHRIQDIVNEVLNLVDKKLQEKKVWWSTAFDPDTPGVYVDFHQIQQVILNLIFNAVDAMEEGGRLLISAAPYKAGGEGYARLHPSHSLKSGRPAYTEVTIQDSGLGIKAEDLENIFDPFFTTKSQGTGLGLAIVYRILSAHGGEIAVTSVPGRGTAVKFLLPTEEVSE